MADVKISELPALTSPDGAEELVVNDGGTTKKITIANATSAALPKAGGTMTGDTLHGDNVKAKFGTGNDLTIHHDGSNSYITDSGTGNLYLKTDGGNIAFLSGDEILAVFSKDDSSLLYYNGSQKLATTATGVDISGTVTADGLTLGDNEKAKFGATSDLEIYQNGNHSVFRDVGAGNIYIQDDNYIELGSVGGEVYLGALKDGAVNLRHNNVKKIETTATGVSVTGTLSTGKVLLNDNGNSTIAGLQLGNQGIGLSVPTTDTMHFLTADQTRMTISSSGNVGIGVTPESHDSNMNSIQLGFGTNLTSWTSSSNTYLMNNSYYNAGWKRINAAKASGYEQDSSGVHKFQVAATGAADSAISWTTAMTIDNSGKVAFSEYNNSPRNGWRIGPRDTTESWSNIAGGSNHVKFYNTNGLVGYIQTSGSATSYSTSSDYRLKTDVQPMTGATATFMQLKPCNFEWIADGTRVDGFLAHELQEVIPAAATGTKDGMMDEEYEVSPATGDVYTAGSDAGFNEVSSAIEASPAYYDVDGNVIKAEVVAVAAVHEAFDSVDEVIHSSDVAQPETLEDGQAWRETTEQIMATRSVPDMQGIDQAKVVPLLVATIQELIARVEALEVVG